MFANTQIFCSATLFFVILNLLVPSIAVQITFFEHSNHEGQSLYVDIAEGVCYNLPPEWNDRVSALVTPSQMCLEVYENAGCTGKWKHFRAGYSMFEELGGTEFNDLISSVGISRRGVNACENI